MASFTFGQPQPQAQQPQPPAAGFSFGQQTQPGLTFGQPASQPQQQQPTTGFSFGQPSGTTAAPFSFGSAAPAASGVSAGFTLGAAPQTTTATPAFSLSLPTTSTTSLTLPASQGLNLGGGTGFSLPGVSGASASTGLGLIGGSLSTSSRATAGDVKSESLPSELSAAVDTFKKYVSEESRLCEQVRQLSVDVFVDVGERVKALKVLVGVVAANNQKDLVLVQKVKVETQQELRNADLLQHTKALSSMSSPSSTLSTDLDTAPNNYLLQFLDNMEVTLMSCAEQLLYLEKLRNKNPQDLKPSGRDLYSSLMKSRDLIISVTAELYDIHETVKRLKADYLSYRSRHQGDKTDVFAGGVVTLTSGQLGQGQGGGKGQGGGVGQGRGLASLTGPTPFTRRETSLAAIMSALDASNLTRSGLGLASGGAAFTLLGQPKPTGLFGAAPLGQTPSTLLSTTGQPIKLGQPPMRGRKGRR